MLKMTFMLKQSDSLTSLCAAFTVPQGLMLTKYLEKESAQSVVRVITQLIKIEIFN